MACSLHGAQCGCITRPRVGAHCLSLFLAAGYGCQACVSELLAERRKLPAAEQEAISGPYDPVACERNHLRRRYPLEVAHTAGKLGDVRTMTPASRHDACVWLMLEELPRQQREHLRGQGHFIPKLSTGPEATGPDDPDFARKEHEWVSKKRRRDAAAAVAAAATEQKRVQASEKVAWRRFRGHLQAGREEAASAMGCPPDPKSVLRLLAGCFPANTAMTNYEQLTITNLYLLLADGKGTAVGMVSTEDNRIEALCVDKEYRRGKRATQLVARATREMECDVVYVQADLTTRPFYKSIGFNDTNEIDSDEHCVAMACQWEALTTLLVANKAPEVYYKQHTFKTKDVWHLRPCW
eukprot:COSAG02_NODE_1533_length_12076_cov_2.829173_13_plen_353_part_00